MAWIGYVTLTLAAVAFGFGLYESFVTEAGGRGQVPVLLHAVASPLFLAVALVHLRSAGVQWARIPPWAIALAFLVLVPVEGYLICKVGRLGQLYHQRQARKSNRSNDSPA